MQLLVGTDAGLFALDPDADARRLSDDAVAALATAGGERWAIVGERVAHWTDDGWEPAPALEGLKPRSLLPLDGAVLVGTSRAYLRRLHDGRWEAVPGFDGADDRDTWHTPWGGPPDTRSLARGTDGALYANVHVGGVLRSPDGEAWSPTMDINADVHEVIAHPTLPGVVLSASARGLALSRDGAASWSFVAGGLPRSYCRAVAVAGSQILISASNGSSGGGAAVHRRPLDGDAAFVRCAEGLPDAFDGNIDTFCLVGSGAEAAFGTEDGRIYGSDDEGATWRQLADGLPPIRCLAVA